MQEVNSVSDPVAPVVTPQVVIKQPKQSNFLVILLSVLLLLSVLIAGFFALQTQKLVKELTILRTEPTPVATVEPTTEPVAIDNSETSNKDESFDCKGVVLGLTMKLPNLTWKCQNDENGYTVTATSKVFTMQITSLGRGDYCEPPIRDPQSPRYDPTLPDDICKITQFYSKNNILLKTYKSYGQTKEIFGQIGNGPSISITYVDMSNRDLTTTEKTEITKILDTVIIK